jgi:hypothetical protein
MTYPPPAGPPDPYQPQQPYGQSPSDPTAPYSQDPYAPPSSGQPAYGQPAGGQPAYGPPPTGDPYAQQPYGATPPQAAQPYGPGYGAAPGTNVMAILALVFGFVFPPLAIVFGHVAKRQISRTGEQGSGLATAGLWLGYIFTALSVFFCGLALVLGVMSDASSAGVAT